MGRSCTRYPDEIREKILNLKREGKTNREIGEAVGLSKDQIAYFLIITIVLLTRKILKNIRNGKQDSRPNRSRLAKNS